MEDDSCKVTALANQKGGVGKTTTTINLGCALARKGKRVLLVDCDPQGSMTVAMGLKPERLDYDINKIMEAVIGGEDFDRYVPIKTKENVDLMPASLDLAGLEVRLVNEMSRERVLKVYIDIMRPHYDHILIDCNPSLGMLTFNALCAADSVIIPAQPEFLAAKGLEMLLKTINKVKRVLNADLAVDGILLTMVDQRTIYTREVTDLIKRAYGGSVRVFETSIPRSVRAAEATADGVSIFTHDPHGKVAESYNNLAKEVFDDGKSKADVQRRRIDAVR